MGRDHVKFGGGGGWCTRAGGLIPILHRNQKNGGQ